KSFDQLWKEPADLPLSNDRSPDPGKVFDGMVQAVTGAALLDEMGLEWPEEGSDLAQRRQVLASTNPSDMTNPRERELCWRAYIFHVLREEVNGAAAALVLPSFRDLPREEQQAFLEVWKKLSDKEKEATLAPLGLKDTTDEARLKDLDLDK